MVPSIFGPDAEGGGTPFDLGVESSRGVNVAEQARLKLTFLGDGFAGGAVPLTVVAAKLQALQQAVFHAAAAAAGHQGERRGLWYNRYRQSAELTFAASHHSNLVIEAELAPDPVLHDSMNLGLKAIDLLFDVARAVETEAFQQIRLTPYDRDYLLRAVEGLMPNVGDQYSIKLENCRADKHPSVTFTGLSRLRVKSFSLERVAPFEAEEPVDIVGELIKIHVDTGDDKITVRSRQRDIDCFYSDALRDQVANQVAGSIVEVRGFPTLGEGGQISRLHQTLSVQSVSTEPLRISRFEDGGQTFLLGTPIAVNVEYTSDGIWVYHHPELNLWGYALRREDALKDLHATFAYMHEQIAEASSDTLDSVAQQLQERFRQLKVRKGGTTVNA
ncbi:MAG TPA: hypothetical protein PK400_01370 [Phycisphaerales bacterium]|nr:hypothetical protein [Phycisphaerales bacterium]HRQ75146.1 hypothetical protein [Phycisphaerales bacterium]